MAAASIAGEVSRLDPLPLVVGVSLEGDEHGAAVAGGGPDQHHAVGRHDRRAESLELRIVQHANHVGGPGKQVRDWERVDPSFASARGANQQLVAGSSQRRAEAVAGGRVGCLQGPRHSPLAVVGVRADGPGLALVRGFSHHNVAVDHQDGAAERLRRARRGAMKKDRSEDENDRGANCAAEH